MFAQGEEFVLQHFGQVGLGHEAHVGRDENAVQETGHERGVVRAQQTPGRVVVAQEVEGGVVEGHGVLGILAVRAAGPRSGPPVLLMLGAGDKEKNVR